MKRTLTDEQIRIFRHSEIHSLLRGREVEAENEAFEQSHSREELDEYAQGGGAVDASAVENENRATVDQSAPAKGGDKPMAMARPSVNSETTLNYEEEDAGQNDQSPKTATATATAPNSGFARRKIISYED